MRKVFHSLSSATYFVFLSSLLILLFKNGPRHCAEVLSAFPKQETVMCLIEKTCVT